MRVFNTAVTIRQGAKTDTDGKVLKAKLLLNWTGPYKVLEVGPCTPTDTHDGCPMSAKVLYLDLPSDMPGADARRRVPVQHCKPCANPHDHGDMPTYVPAELTQYVLNTSPKIPRVPRHSRRRFDKYSKCRTSPDTDRIDFEVESSR